MPTFELKRYQAQALDSIDRFLRSASLLGVREAFYKETRLNYGTGVFGDTPCVCLRIPTGGGKTLLAAHAVGRLQREWPVHTAQPLALWLVPTDAIRTQTLLALATPGHPVRAALVQGCGEDVRVCDLDAVATLSPQDFDNHAVVVVASMQSFRVDKTDTRNVYAFNEAFEPHFASLPPGALHVLQDLPDALVTAADVETPADNARGAPAGRSMLARFVGQPRWSLANWLALRRPYVIVDEAHNSKTARSFQALQRLNPALILELTATPHSENTNVLFHVSAQQLQAEDMIKMPIALIEHTRGWKAAVLDAVQTQRLLEAQAQQEEAATGDYIRPIVLLQAQNQNDAVNVDVLRQHLVDELHIPPDQVKVATGTQRELDDLNLADRGCPVRYIITVQALREGWDCPFAYVLCSVQAVRSATAIEQLLGRVLRMPYARRRTQAALNKAYAHVTESETGMAANALADRLIEGMGFDPLDVVSMLVPQLPLTADNGRDDGPLFKPAAAELPPIALAVDLPAHKPLPAAVAEVVQQGTATVSTDAQRQRVVLRGAIGAAVANALVAAQPRKLQAEVARQVEQHNALVAGAQAPAARGEYFSPVPRLCFKSGSGEQQTLALLERADVLEAVELNLLAQPVRLDGFQLAEQGTNWELYLDGTRLRVGRTDPTQLPLDAVETTISANDLARWLADELQQPARNVASDILPAQLRAFVLASVNHLVHEQHIPVSQLARHQYPLVQRLAQRIADLRDEAAKHAFRQLVLDGGWDIAATSTEPAHEFRFDPSCYPVQGNKRYQGKFKFPKHFYAVLSDLTDGSEEWHCALAIDQHPQMLRWVRNLDSDPVYGFWLPTSSGRFYPDFVCELVDKRILVAEYKGAHLRSVPKEIEKSQIGALWAARSGGKAVFCTLYKTERDMSLSQQIDFALR